MGLAVRASAQTRRVRLSAGHICMYMQEERIQVKLSRRSFLKASALGLGAAAVAGATPFPAVADESHRKNETGKWTSTACQGCTSFCPLKVYVEDGRAISASRMADMAVRLICDGARI